MLAPFAQLTKSERKDDDVCEGIGSVKLRGKLISPVVQSERVKLRGKPKTSVRESERAS